MSYATALPKELQINMSTVLPAINSNLSLKKKFSYPAKIVKSDTANESCLMQKFALRQ
jgi:hypothetical protein